MQNDAKLGLLAGVLGVIVAATISGKSPSALNTPTAPSSAASKSSPAALAQGRINEAAPAALPTDLNTTPVSRTQKDVQAIATARQSADGNE